eukprot:6391087-Amphidinium_carterae.1
MPLCLKNVFVIWYQEYQEYNGVSSSQLVLQTAKAKQPEMLMRLHRSSQALRRSEQSKTKRGTQLAVLVWWCCLFHGAAAMLARALSTLSEFMGDPFKRLKWQSMSCIGGMQSNARGEL